MKKTCYDTLLLYIHIEKRATTTPTTNRKMIIVHSVCIQRKNPSIHSFSREYCLLLCLARIRRFLYVFFSLLLLLFSFRFLCLLSSIRKREKTLLFLLVLLLSLLLLLLFLLCWLFVREMLWKFIETALRSPKQCASLAYIKIHIFFSFQLILLLLFLLAFFVCLYFFSIKIYTIMLKSEQFKCTQWL